MQRPRLDSSCSTNDLDTLSQTVNWTVKLYWITGRLKSELPLKFCEKLLIWSGALFVSSREKYDKSYMAAGYLFGSICHPDIAKTETIGSLYQTNISCSMAMSSRRICNRARVLKVLVVGTRRRSRDVGIFCVAVDACGSNPNRGDSNTSFGSRGASKKFWNKHQLIWQTSYLSVV